MSSLVYLLPLFGVVGLLYMTVLQAWVKKQDAGDDKMRSIATHIADGAMAFLKAEYRVLAIYVVVAGLLLGWQSMVVTTSHPLIVVAFVIGAAFSVLAGYSGMRIATKANVRTTQAARTSLAKALKVSFNGGSVMGLGVAGLAVLGLSALFALFFNYFMGGSYGPDGPASMARVYQSREESVGMLSSMAPTRATDAARTIVAPAELPIGILTAGLGAPFFLALLLRRRALT